MNVNTTESEFNTLGSLLQQHVNCVNVGELQTRYSGGGRADR